MRGETKACKLRRPRWGLTFLETLPVKEAIYQGTDKQGMLLFHPLLGLRKGSVSILADRATIALGLTEECCRQGKGKVSFYRRPLHTY